MKNISKEQLSEILVKHKLWLKGEPNGEKADLSRADLSRADLSRANLREADLSRADLSRADLREADLKKSTILTPTDGTNALLGYISL